MHIHILGVAGTFMAGIATLAKNLGFKVTGSDEGIYPPMSDTLAEQDITFMQGYEPSHLQPAPDLVIVGNALSRGNKIVETMLNEKIPYISGPQWLAETILHKKWVIAVAGTHGKTTTVCMITWILQTLGLEPGFLIGGIPGNFSVSAKMSDSSYFVIEADEYDSAFFDKRSKFVHYRPRTLVLNNLEFDHADIFDSLEDIQKQFHYLIRTVPGNGKIIYHADDVALKQTLEKGCWTDTETFSTPKGQWRADCLQPDGSHFAVYDNDVCKGEVNWSLFGQHNVNNALAAIAACKHIQIEPEQAVAALANFKLPARRMQFKACINDISIYDDFAHHPTAIKMTLAGFRQKIGDAARLIVLWELRSYTMRTGIHEKALPDVFQYANDIYVLEPSDTAWDVRDMLKKFNQPSLLFQTVEDMIVQVVSSVKPGDYILTMSNGAFGHIHSKLAHAINHKP